jgi:hypothetical protein
MIARPLDRFGISTFETSNHEPPPETFGGHRRSRDVEFANSEPDWVGSTVDQS